MAHLSDASRERWRFPTPGSPNMSGVAGAYGVVSVQSLHDGTRYALDARTGATLAPVLTGGAHSGPAVANGRLFLGTGPTFGRIAQVSDPGAPGIVAVGLDHDDRSPRPMLRRCLNGSGRYRRHRP